MSNDAPDLFVLRSDKNQIIIRAAIGAPPSILLFGTALDNSRAQELALLSTRQWAFGGENEVIEPSLSSESGLGYSGPAGLIANRAGEDWAPVLNVTRVNQPTQQRLEIICADEVHSVGVIYTLTLDPVTHILQGETEIENLSKRPLSIHWCAALCLPIDQQFKQLLSPHKSILPERLKLPTLDPKETYRIKLIWPEDARSITQPSIIDAALLSEAGAIFTGEVLSEYGIQIPFIYPETCPIFHLERDIP